MRHILVASDLTARSDRALQRAFALAHERQATVDVLHVIDDGLPTSLQDRQVETARRAIHDQVATIASAREVSWSATVVPGVDYETILERASAVEAGLIVLGIHRHETRELFRGTTAERVIRYGQFPVLMVRQPVVAAYRRVVVGLDMSVHAQCALEVAARLAPRGEFHLVHAVHAPFKGFLGRETIRGIVRQERARFEIAVQREIEDLKQRFGDEAPRCQLVVEEGLVLEVLRAKIGQIQPDLIAIGTHGRSGVANAILGSVAEDLLADAPVDVLAVKAW
jgi:nucleotide-binding universal stress UspA family protein